MASDEAAPLDAGALAWGVRLAYLAVNAAVPLPFAEAGVVEASPAEKHVLELRAIAFGAVLDQVLDYGCEASPADLTALEQGAMPAWNREG